MRLGYRKRQNTEAFNAMYRRWYFMVKRCHDTTDKDFRHYGGRGISVCKEWADSVDAFIADMGYAPDGYSLDRIDNDGNYCKENCRWATRSEQAMNRRCRGYTRHKQTGRFQVSFMSKYCGLFDTEAEARAKYLELKGKQS